MIVFLISNIAPNTRKATSEEGEKVLLKELATKASACEHKDMT
jgi:hypothetical protein